MRVAVLLLGYRYLVAFGFGLIVRLVVLSTRPNAMLFSPRALVSKPLMVALDRDSAFKPS